MYQCPITRDWFQDPVVASDGHTYERIAITRWMSNRPGVPQSPMTNLPFPTLQLFPNHALKAASAAHREALARACLADVPDDLHAFPPVEDPRLLQAWFDALLADEDQDALDLAYYFQDAAPRFAPWAPRALAATFVKLELRSRSHEHCFHFREGLVGFLRRFHPVPPNPFRRYLLQHLNRASRWWPAHLRGQYLVVSFPNPGFWREVHASRFLVRDLYQLLQSLDTNRTLCTTMPDALPAQLLAATNSPTAASRFIHLFQNGGKRVSQRTIVRWIDRAYRARIHVPFRLLVHSLSDGHADLAEADVVQLLHTALVALAGGFFNTANQQLGASLLGTVQRLAVAFPTAVVTDPAFRLAVKWVHDSTKTDPAYFHALSVIRVCTSRGHVWAIEAELQVAELVLASIPTGPTPFNNRRATDFVRTVLALARRPSVLDRMRDGASIVLHLARLLNRYHACISVVTLCSNLLQRCVCNQATLSDAVVEQLYRAEFVNTACVLLKQHAKSRPAAALIALILERAPLGLARDFAHAGGLVQVWHAFRRNRFRSTDSLDELRRTHHRILRRTTLGVAPPPADPPAPTTTVEAMPPPRKRRRQTTTPEAPVENSDTNIL